VVRIHVGEPAHLYQRCTLRALSFPYEYPYSLPIQHHIRVLRIHVRTGCRRRDSGLVFGCSDMLLPFGPDSDDSPLERTNMALLRRQHEKHMWSSERKD
jgi:hypothetical protein